MESGYTIHITRQPAKQMETMLIMNAENVENFIKTQEPQELLINWIMKPI